MSFPNPPADGQVYDHPNGLQYVYNLAASTWDLVYSTGSNTGSLPLINPSSYTLPTSLPEVPPGLVVQADYNAWLFDALQHVNKEANVEVESAPGPTDPDEGRLWYNSDTGKLYLYYSDGTSSQWIEIVGGADIDLDGYATETYVDDAIAAIPDVDLTGYATETYVDDAIAAIPDTDLSDYETIANSQAADANLQNQIDALEVQKGALATYDCAAISLPYNSRAGECMFSDDTASDVVVIGFGAENKVGGLTESIHTGDIIEIIKDGVISRYTVLDDNSAPSMVAVSFVSGEQTFAIGSEYTVYIYPQNAAGVSKEYVDNQDDLKLDLTGGTLTGNLYLDTGSGLYSKEIIKSTRDTGYALQVKPGDIGDATAYIHTNGNAEFAHVKVRDTPSKSTDLTTKEYVDNAVASVSAPPTGPATLAWEWRNHDTLSDPGEGKVAWYSASQIYRLNLKSANGVDLGKNRIAPKDHSFSTKPYGSVWAYVNGGWQLIKMFDIGRIQWNKNDCIWVYSSTTHFGSNNFTAGQTYYFTVGGFF